MVKQISAFVENKPGRMMETIKELAKAKVDLKALSLADTSEFGIVRMVVSDSDLAKKVLNEDGIVVRITNITAIAVSDEPGAMMKMLQLLSDNNISIEYMYVFGKRYDDMPVIAVRTEEPDKADEILADGGVKILSQSEIEAM